MVSILPPKTNAGDLIGQKLGQGLESGMNQAYQRGLIQKALKQVEGLEGQKASPYKIASALMGATAGIPGAERYVGQLLPLLMQQSQAQAGQNVNITPEELPRNAQGQVARPERGPLPQFAGQQGSQEQFFPSNIPGNEAPGQAPQAATEGQKRPVLNANQLYAEGKRIAKEATDNGIPTSPQDGYLQAKTINDENKTYNENVENERKERIEFQKEYGQRAQQALLKVLPEATDEQQAIFQKRGEQLAGSGKSEADINRHIAKEATNFKNTIANVREKLSSPPRLQNLYQKFTGTRKSIEQASNDARTLIKPLLDEGLYDTARNLLQESGFYPEEREAVINPLGDRSKASIKLIPASNLDKEDINETGLMTPRMKTNMADSIRDVLKNDPNVSLVLLRKAFEDKGYGWRPFKDTINELSALPKDQGGIDLSDDQFNQLIYLDTPPLNELDKILHKFNIMGR